MQDTKNTKPHLTRETLAEVIRANVAAFKDEPNFYDYLTELVIYLMEYEYVWPDEERDPNPHVTRGLKTKSDATYHPYDYHDPRATKYRFSFIQPLNLSDDAQAVAQRQCRMCGAELGDKMVCPNCLVRNRVK